MDKKIPLALVIAVAIAVGYLMGTESGRQQREVILVKLGRGPADDSAETDARRPRTTMPTEPVTDTDARAPLN